MARANYYDVHDAVGLAELVRRREVHPVELVELAIERIEQRNPIINAIVYKMYEEARRAALLPLPDSPLAGLPFVVKDLIATCVGVPTSSGTKLLRDCAEARDSEMVRRFRKGGLIIVGKSNTPEFGLNVTTEPYLFGPTRNPWDLSRTTGGSSGGSAAAVAAGIVPLAHGGDGGGSIRIPASCCGLVGLKPTRGRTPVGPRYGTIWDGLVVEHGMTRSVRDTAALLDLTAGPDVGLFVASPSQPRSFLTEVTNEPGRLRIGFTSEGPFTASSIHPDCVVALDSAALLCSELGHVVEPTAPLLDPVDHSALGDAFLAVVCAQTAVDIAEISRQMGRQAEPSEFEPATWELSQMGRRLSATQYVEYNRVMHRVTRQVGSFFEDYDVLMTPTLAAPPLALGVLNAPGAPIDEHMGRIFDFIPYTSLFNITGQPAISLPLSVNAQGLPIGVQLVAKFGDEATLLRLAGQIERASPFPKLPTWKSHARSTK